ncbi:MAG: phosphatidylserine/phosphatidylglycerophosphate/cardiolipin synthase family protein [Gaiellaceae bacterium]
MSLERFDEAIGERLERAVVAHHRRRLRRIGQLGALDAPPGGWADVLPERGGNEVEVLVDGEAALPRIAEEIAGARSHVELAGWHFAAGFRLEQPGGASLRELLADAAQRIEVRVLVWAGSPLPLFRPYRAQVRRSMLELTEGTSIRCGLDARERPMHCHHEKLVIVDGRVAFVGGIDLTDLAGDRFDRSTHPARPSVGWHDAAVRLRGPAVADVSGHFRMRWREVTREALGPPEPQEPVGQVAVQVVRTVPEHIYDAVPRGDFGILESYLRALRGAERLVYLENQFLWSPEVVDVLADKLRRPPGDDFRLLVVLPAKPNSGNDDTRGQLGILLDADGGAGRFLACTLYQHGAPAVANAVYVHAKIGIVDDRWLTVGSANLNEHSLFNDTEMNVVLHDPALARATRLRLWAEHLECAQSELQGDPTALLEARWRPLADEQLERLRRGEPLTHRLARLPHVSRRAGRLLGPVSGLLVDG